MPFVGLLDCIGLIMPQVSQGTSPGVSFSVSAAGPSAASTSPLPAPAEMSPVAPEPAAPSPTMNANVFQSGDFTLEWQLGPESITFTVSMGTAGVAALHCSAWGLLLLLLLQETVGGGHGAKCMAVGGRCGGSTKWDEARGTTAQRHCCLADHQPGRGWAQPGGLYWDTGSGCEHW